MGLHAHALASVDAAPEDIDSAYQRQFMAMHHRLPQAGRDHISCTAFTPDKVIVFEIAGLPESPDDLEVATFEPGWIGRLAVESIGGDPVIRAIAISRHTLAMWASHTVLVTAAGMGFEYSMMGPFQVFSHSKSMQRDVVEAGKELWGASWEPTCSCGSPFGHECDEEG